MFNTKAKKQTKLNNIKRRNANINNYKAKILENTGHSGTKSETYTRGLQYAFEKPNLKIPEELLKKYTGTYQSKKGNKIELKAENSHLVFKKQNVIEPFDRIAGSEDFAYFLQARPGCFLRLGNGATPMVHNAKYDFNDESLLIGAAYWTRLVERYLT